MIEYVESIENISPDMLEGFFVGWLNPPSREKHLEILEKSDRVILAIDTDSNRVVGFIYAITDGVLSAYLPLLEVLPDYQGRGIGSELVSKMLGALSDLYMVDLICDSDLQPYYEKLGMTRTLGMSIRNYKMQSGK